MLKSVRDVEAADYDVVIVDTPGSLEGAQILSSPPAVTTRSPGTARSPTASDSPRSPPPATITTIGQTRAPVTMKSSRR